MQVGGVSDRYRKYICLFAANPVLASWLRFHMHAELPSLPLWSSYFFSSSISFRFFWGNRKLEENGAAFFTGQKVENFNFELDNGWIHFSSFLPTESLLCQLALSDVHNLSRLKDGVTLCVQSAVK